MCPQLYNSSLINIWNIGHSILYSMPTWFSFVSKPGVCRYPAGTLTRVRGMQVPCRYSDQSQGYAGTLQVLWPESGVCRRWSTESLTQHFPGWFIRRLSACTHMPHRTGNSVGGPPLFNVGIRNPWGHCERPNFCPHDTELFVFRWNLSVETSWAANCVSN